MHGSVQVTYYHNFLGKHVNIYFSRRNTPSLAKIIAYISVHDPKNGMLSRFSIEMHPVFLEA